MKYKLPKIIVFVLILVFYGLLLAHKVELPEADDMARHIINGKLILQGSWDVVHSNVYSYTDPNHKFINHNWFAAVIFYLLHQAVGWTGLVIFKIIVLLSAFATLFAASLKRSNFWLVALFSIPTILILRERTQLRPEIFSYLFIAIFIYLLLDFDDDPNTKKIYWLIPLQLLWVNIHLFFIVGNALVGGLLLEKVILNYKHLKNNPVIKKLSVVFIALLFVNFINPNGIIGALYPFQIFNNYGINVVENNSILQTIRNNWFGEDISIVVFVFGAAFLVLSFLFNFRRKSSDNKVSQDKPRTLMIFYFLASITTAIAGFIILRTVAFFGLIFLPVSSANFNSAFVRVCERIKTYPGLIQSIKKVLVTGLVLMLGYFIFQTSSGHYSQKTVQGLGLSQQSSTAGEFIKQNNIHGPIFNDYDIGAYLIYYLYPQEKVFIDNRPEAYSAQFLTETYAPIFNDETKWQEVLDKYQFNTLVFYQYDIGPYVRQFMQRRAKDPEWALVFSDQYALILVRNNDTNKQLIDKFHITPENAADKLITLSQSKNYDDQIAVADTFNLLGRVDLAQGKFWHIVSQWPDKGRVWMIMGEWEYDIGDPRSPYLAIMFLNKAIDDGVKSAEVYSFLGASYQRTGQMDKAEEAVRQALKINPERLDARDILDDLMKQKEGNN